MRVARWEQAVRPHFDFLLEHGFHHAPDDASSEWFATQIAYRSDVHAVVVRFSVEFDRVEVALARLVGGEIPTGVIFYTESESVDQTLLDNVVIARAPERVIEIQRATGLKRRAVEDQLVMWSGVLRELAPDFLAGQDKVFDEVKDVIRERVSAEPQQVVVWLPESASPEEERARVENTRKTVPPEVDVVSRRYRRPAGPLSMLRRWKG